MKKENRKEFFCTVRTDTAYGKNVLNCVEQLKDRFGLSVSRILQDAILFYEQATRDKEILPVNLDKKIEKIEYPGKVPDLVEKVTDKNEIMLSLLSTADGSEYQM